MKASVIVRSRDEADRLRLTLDSLARQSVEPEVVVVNDGSVDHTADVVAEAALRRRLTVIRHSSARGRSAASNAGARAACGDILIFLDGDTLAHPDLVRRHVEAHAKGGSLIGRGEPCHLRCTRFLADPETGRPRPGEEARLAAIPQAERDKMLVTRLQIAEDFAAIERRAEPGIYPGTAPRRLNAIEMDALSRHPDCTVLWAAACGSNMSVGRAAFLDAGGFDATIDSSEHRELALRLCLGGARMTMVETAKTYHLTHRAGWRDPLSDRGWEEAFYRAHPIPEVRLLAVFWASLSDRSPIPAHARIHTLPQLQAAAEGRTGVDYEAVRRAFLDDSRQPATAGLV